MANGGKVNLGFGGKVNLGGGGKVNLGFGSKVKVGGGGKVRLNGPSQQHHGGGGFFGGLEHLGHWVGQKASLAGHDIEGIPGGTYHFAKDLGETIIHPPFTKAGKRANERFVSGDLKGVAKQSYESIRHPLRDPFQTALTVAPGLGALGRTGELVRGVDITEPRLLKVGDERFNLSPPSKGAAGRMGQRVYDKALQRGLDRNPEGRLAAHANRRIGKQILEAERPRQAMRATKADVLQKAGRKLSRSEQAALRLTSENITPTEARLFHEEQAAKGIAPVKHRNWAKVYRQIEQRHMLKQDEHGNVVVNAALHPHLAKVDKLLAEAQRSGEKIIHEHDLMTAEGAKERLNAPGQQIRGALKEEQRQRPIYGPEGRGFVTEKQLENKAPKTGAARASSPVVGETRTPISAKARTGVARAKGEIPDNTTRLVAQNLRGLQRYVNTHELRQRWLDAGSDVRRSSRDILIRVPGAKKEDISPAIEDLLGRKKLTLEELVGATEGARSHLEDIIPGLRNKFAEDNRAMIGEKAPKGYKWVDRNLVGDYANSFSGSRGKIGRAFDNVNSAITAATVYYKIGHVGTRVLTNAATNIIQGSARPDEIARNFGLFKKLSEADRRRAWAAAGQHGFEAMPHEGAGKLGAVATKGAQFWAHRADAMFRFNSIAFEARKAGFKTPAQFKDFLNKLEHPEGLSAEERARVENVAKRANRESIAYDRLSDSEKRFISRAFWFWPWVKGSVTFSGRTLVEHPYKSLVAGNLGAKERQRQEKILGAIPSYEFGLFPVGGPNAKGNVPVSNLETFSPFSTAGNLLQIPEYQAAAQNLNPGAAALLSLLTRTNQYGQHSNTPLTDALQSLTSATPELQIGQAVSGHKKSKMFPASNNFESQLLRFLIGPAYPRQVNLADLNKAAGLEKTGR